jgi:hypothetical protein
LGEKNGPYLMKTPKTQAEGLKKCSHCKGDIQGYDSWILKDYADFAETKAFMRAVGKAYNVALFDDLTDDTKRNAIDISEYIQEPSDTTNKSPPPPKDPPTSPYQSPPPGDEEFENPFDIEGTPEAALQTQTPQVQFDKEKYEKLKEDNRTFILVPGEIKATTEKAVNFFYPDMGIAVWVPKAWIKQTEKGYWFEEWKIINKIKESLAA